MTRDFTYRVRQRSAGAWAGLGSGLVMMALALERNAPLWAWVLLTPCIVVCVLQIALRPSYGLTLTARALRIFEGYSERTLPLAGVDHLRVDDTGAYLVMRTGDEVPLPRHVLRNTLALIREVTERGIPVRSA